MKRLFFFVSIFSILFFFWGSLWQNNDPSFTALVIQFPNEYVHEGDVDLQIRVKEIKRGWSEFETVNPDIDLDEHGFEEDETHETPEVFYQVNESSAFEYRWMDKTGNHVKWLEPHIETFSYGKSKNIPSKLLASVEIPNSVRIINRDQWGANETYLFETPDSSATNGTNGEELESEEAPQLTTEPDPEIDRIVTHDSQGRKYRWPLQYAKDIKFAVVHHTASQRNLDNPEVAVQNIYYYHAVRRGWGDIGYHYIIAPNGEIYEGRFGGNKIIGGHARQVNKVSVGVAVLGNYDEGEIPVQVLRSIFTLTNLLTKQYDIDSDGSTVYKDKTYKNIMGHRDASSTICPGKFLFAELFGVRKIVNDTQDPTANTLFQHLNGDIITISPESEKSFELELKNISNQTWNSGTLLKLPFLPGDFEELQFVTKPTNATLVASLQNFPIPPGSIGKFQGKMKSKISSGLRLFMPKLSVNGSTVAQTDPFLRLAVFVEGASPSYEVALRHDPKNLLSPGEETEGFIELKNTGNITWKKEGPNRVVLAATHPRNRTSPFFENQNVIALLEQTEVKPGEIGRFIFHVKAPQTPGTYMEYFTPRIDGIRYLEEKNLNLSLKVEGNSEIAAPTFPIRIKLSFENTPKITSSTRLVIFEGNRYRKIFPAGVTLNVRKLPNGKFYVTGGGTSYALASPVRIKPYLDGILKITNWENGREFRGTIEVRTVDGKLVVINELHLEKYLLGVAEETNDTPYEKIKAISILARTYAQFYMTKAEKFPGKPYHLEDDPRTSQKYLGYSFEKRAPNIVKAVKETKGKLVTYQKKLVKTPYFSQSDGRTRSGEEVFGWKNTPYLVSVPDPDCAGRELRGHGVGLSGCGAEAKAKRGESSEKIITYYYQGVEVLGGN